MEETVERAVAKGLLNIHNLAIGEGNYGIIFEIPGFPDLCGKYAKFHFDIRELWRLEEAHKCELPVPKPFERVPGTKTFLMERIHGKNLEELEHEGKFCGEVAEQIVLACKLFCSLFCHNDLFPRNIMLRHPRVTASVITSGTPIIVDLERTIKGENEEWKGVQEWLERRVF